MRLSTVVSHAVVPASLVGIYLVGFTSPPVTEFSPPVQGAGPSSLQLAHAYAAAEGLTDCGAPEDADLDDVFLTRHVDSRTLQPVGNLITPVDLDTALDSKNRREVVLACTPTK